MIKYLLTKCMIYMYLYKVAIVARIITKSFNSIFIIKHSFITICQCSFICIIVVHVNVYNYFDYFIKVSDFLQLHVLYIIIHIWTVYQSLWSEQQYAIIKNYKIRYNKPTNTRENKLWIFFIAFFFFTSNQCMRYHGNRTWKQHWHRVQIRSVHRYLGQKRFKTTMKTWINKWVYMIL